jgi:hypothetical protein
LTRPTGGSDSRVFPEDAAESPDWGDCAKRLTDGRVAAPEGGEESAAAEERLNHRTDAVAAGDVHFYRSDTQAAGERATLVWNRRAVGCLEPGCNTTALTLSNLDLDQVDPSSGALEARSASSIDNVEQVRSPAGGQAIYKVRSTSTVDGLPGEPYALAARRPLTRLTTPRPRTRVTLSTTTARPGNAVTVVAELSNPSPDLSAENATATVVLPNGVRLSPGSAATQAAGILAPGASKSVSWTVQADGDSVNWIGVRTSAARYGETFSSEDGATFTSDGSAPGVAAAAGPPVETAIPVAWSATDAGSGVRDYTIEVATDGGPFAPWLSATTATSGSYAGTYGSRYRFRVRAVDHLGNVSDWVTTDEIAVARGVPEPPPAVGPEPPPAPPLRANPALRITSMTRRGGRILVRGSIAATAARRVTVTLSARSGKRRVSVRGYAPAQAGRFKLSLRAPRRLYGTLAVSYAGDDWLLAANARAKLRGL